MWPTIIIIILRFPPFSDSGGSPTQRGGHLGLPPSIGSLFPAKAIALRYSREIVILTPSSYTFSPMSHLLAQSLISNTFHCQRCTQNFDVISFPRSTFGVISSVYQLNAPKKKFNHSFNHPFHYYCLFIFNNTRHNKPHIWQPNACGK